MLKPLAVWALIGIFAQPPSGGCVLKLNNEDGLFKMKLQPPSGGCVLKRLV